MASGASGVGGGVFGGDLFQIQPLEAAIFAKRLREVERLLASGYRLSSARSAIMSKDHEIIRLVFDYGVVVTASDLVEASITQDEKIIKYAWEAIPLNERALLAQAAMGQLDRKISQERAPWLDSILGPKDEERKASDAQDKAHLRRSKGIIERLYRQHSEPRPTSTAANPFYFLDNPALLGLVQRTQPVSTPTATAAPAPSTQLTQARQRAAELKEAADQADRAVADAKSRLATKKRQEQEAAESAERREEGERAVELARQRYQSEQMELRSAQSSLRSTRSRYESEMRAADRDQTGCYQKQVSFQDVEFAERRVQDAENACRRLLDALESTKRRYGF